MEYSGLPIFGMVRKANNKNQAMYKKMDYRAVIAALIFLAGLIFLVRVGSAWAQPIVEPLLIR